jgi:nicotinamidase-related amidase
MMTMAAGTTAVLFVECQNGLLGAHSVMKALAEGARPQIAAMARLAEGARAAGVRVVHLTYAPVAGNRSSNQKPPLFGRLLPALAEWHPRHEAVQPIPEIGVGPDDLVLQRHSGMSPTYGTETYKLLRNIGVDTIVFAGISVNVAIPVAATEAGDENFEVVVARDAVAGIPDEHVTSMLLHTLPFIATLHTVDELLAAWGVDGTARQPAGPIRTEGQP